MTEIFALLIAFQAKHFLADYPLQRPYMLRKFEAWPGFLLPLLAHAGVHGVMTALICWFYGSSAALFFGLADVCVHFIVDRAKAAPTWGGRWKPTNPRFWWALGGDQMAHHLTHYAIIWALVAV